MIRQNLTKSRRYLAQRRLFDGTGAPLSATAIAAGLVCLRFWLERRFSRDLLAVKGVPQRCSTMYMHAP